MVFFDRVPGTDIVAADEDSKTQMQRLIDARTLPMLAFHDQISDH